MTEHRAPRDNLTRALADGVSLDENGKTLFGRIAPANEWAEIRSSVEGHFLERNAPGAFKKTFAERMPKILFNHGRDATLGNQIIAQATEVGEDAQGGYYRAELLDGLPALLLDGLKRNLYGASHTFSVVRETWNDRPKRTDANPNGLPERTILEARVDELGPVTWPAFAGAFSGVRSLTDAYTLDRLAGDPGHLRDLVGYVTDPSDVPADIAPSDAAGAGPHDEPERRDTEPEPIPAPAAASPAASLPERNTTVEYVTRDEKAARVTELRAELARVASEYPGVLPEPEQARWDTSEQEMASLEADIAAWDNRQAKVRAFAESNAATAPVAYSAPTIVRKVEDIYDFGEIKKRARSVDEVLTITRDNALRSVEASAARGVPVDFLADLIEYRDSGEEGKGEVATRTLATGSPVYRRAYNSYLKHGTTEYMSPEEHASFRAAALAVVGTTTTGGYAVPYVFDPTMIRIGAYTAQNPYREACRVETITNGNNWLGVTVGAVTSAYVAEPTAATEQGPTFAQPNYTVQRAHAFATLSIETLQDRPDIASELTAVFAESKATYEENQFTLGVGTTVFPQGMFRTTAYTATNTATDNVTALSDTQLVEAALPLRFRAKGAWFMNRSTIRQLQVLDTTRLYFSGAGLTYAGQSNPNSPGPNSTGNTGLTLLGYPVWEVPSAVSTLTTDASIIAVFCDPKTYIIVDRIGMNVEVIPNMLNGATPSFPTGQRGIYMYWRNTAKPLLADGGRQLTVF